MAAIRSLCSSCGRPTTGDFPVCSRPSCVNEYRRLERIAQKTVPSVYAVWFPAPRTLKIGFTTDKNNGIFTGVARTRAKRRGWATRGVACIWKRPGDLRTEAWMQATLAFRWYPAFEQRSMKVCEWFSIPDLRVDDIAEALDGTYGLLPADLIAGAAPEFPSAYQNLGTAQVAMF